MNAMAERYAAALLDVAMGPGRFTKSSERLREGRKPARGLALSAVEGKRLIGTVRLWPVTAGAAGGCLLLGPLAVASDVRSRGVGADLMWRALRAIVTKPTNGALWPRHSIRGMCVLEGYFEFAYTTVRGKPDLRLVFLDIYWQQ